MAVEREPSETSRRTSISLFPDLTKVFNGALPNSHVLLKLGVLKPEDMNDFEKVQKAIRQFVPPLKRGT